MPEAGVLAPPTVGPKEGEPGAATTASTFFVSKGGGSSPSHQHREEDHADGHSAPAAAPPPPPLHHGYVNARRVRSRQTARKRVPDGTRSHHGTATEFLHQHPAASPPSPPPLAAAGTVTQAGGVEESGQFFPGETAVGRNS